MVTLVTDTTSSIPVEEAERLGIPYIPQIIVFGDQTYRDDTEIDIATFLKKLRESVALPKTAAPPPVLYHPVYEKFGTEGNTIIVLTPSGELSGTYRSATTAAQEFPQADIRVIDTKTIGSGLAALVLMTNDWINDGLSADDIVERVNQYINRQKVYFVVDTLTYLYKGGRIGGAKMLFGSLLQVKPILELRNGRTEAAESQRTKKRAIARLKELIYTDCARSEDPHLGIMHGDIEAEARELAEEFKATLGIKSVGIYNLPPAVLVHAGPGVLAVTYFTEPNP
ncbi:MAG TPA: DegV family protein [Bellilinea sp.]|jgi:DegV family protein with EDD domain|nr:DegV family protein [Bellilinea sp.]